MKTIEAKDLKHYVRAMSSLEIAQITGKRHDHVMRDIKKLIKHYEAEPASSHLSWLIESSTYNNPQGSKSHSPDLGGENVHVKQGTYINTRGKSHTHYELDYKATIHLLVGYNHVLRELVIDRWLELEKENTKLITERGNTKESWVVLNETACIAYEETHTKATPSYIYSNNATLINKLVIGKSAKDYRKVYNLPKNVPIRDNFTKVEMAQVTKIEKIMTSLIELGFTYPQYKKVLLAKFG